MEGDPKPLTKEANPLFIRSSILRFIDESHITSPEVALAKEVIEDFPIEIVELLKPQSNVGGRLHPIDSRVEVLSLLQDAASLATDKYSLKEVENNYVLSSIGKGEQSQNSMARRFIRASLVKGYQISTIDDEVFIRIPKRPKGDRG